MEHPYTNALIHATSPYLLGHAHNPVDWHPWDEALTLRAKKANKLLLVSIGYSACHWCHVMEKESFEDAGVAEVMNRHFICVKVDREERPDVDHFFMTAVQLMGQPGGWPLNVIALPDGRPIWGVTYLPKGDWLRSISTVAAFFRENKAKTEAYGAELKSVIRQVSLSAGTGKGPPVPASQPLLKRGVARWKKRFDAANGGNRGAPKFPLPGNLHFLLSYGILMNDREVLDHAEKTLEYMARGGIYDQIGGGFARYSTDEKWKVPHFEKMLYDNGQLLSIYSRAFQYYRKTAFKTVVEGTVDFLERELRDPSGAFYSSLDADSEGVEGNYYVWKADELRMILGRDYPLFARYFGVLSEGFWERGKNILVRPKADVRFAAENGISEYDLQEKVNDWKKRLLMERSRRVPPALDDKTLSSWNALVIQGLADAYKALGNARFKRLAVETGMFLKKNVLLSDGKLFHSWKNGESAIDGFLEDYACVIQAFTALFGITGDTGWLGDASLVMEYTFRHFFNEKDHLFYFSEKGQEHQTITNHYPNEDTVMPSANSVMANNLYHLGVLMGNAGYLHLAKRMVHAVTPSFPQSPMAFSNWGVLMLQITNPAFEVVLCGPGAEKKFIEMQKDYHPNVLFAFSEKEGDLALFKGRFVPGKTLIYVCRNGSCRLPVESAAEALKMFSR